MKKICVLLFSVMLMTVCTNSYAQFMGGNGKSQYVKSDSFSVLWLGYAPTNWKTGDSSVSGYNTFSFGLTHMSSLSGSAIYLEYGAYVDWMNKSKSSTSTNFLDITIPLNLMYPLPIADGITFYPYTGLNVRGFIFGKRTTKSGENSLTYDYFGDSGYYNRFGLGYQLGLSARISSFLVRIGYQDMFTSIHKDNTQKFNYLTLGVGIPF